MRLAAELGVPMRLANMAFAKMTECSRAGKTASPITHLRLPA